MNALPVAQIAGFVAQPSYLRRQSTTSQTKQIAFHVIFFPLKVGAMAKCPICVITPWQKDAQDQVFDQIFTRL